MAMTKQRKMLLTVAALGLVTVAVDQLVLAPPGTASADQDTAPEPSPAVPAVQPAAVNEPVKATGDNSGLPSYQTLTERLIKTAVTTPAEQRIDPFQLPEGWGTPIVMTTETPQQPTKQGLYEELEKRLLDQYILDGTYRSTSQSGQELVAVVRGRNMPPRLMRVGDRVPVEMGVQSSDGKPLVKAFRLEEVGAGAVLWVLESDPTKKFEMRTKEPL